MPVVSPLVQAFFFSKVAGSVRFSDSFNGLEDSCKFTYLDFFRDLSCNPASTTCWVPVVKTWLKPERDEAEIGKRCTS